jgi:plasmid stabilization system protein ParE
MKLRFTLRVVENIAELADYIRTRDPRAAERLRADIYASQRNVILFAKVGPPTDG